MSTAEPTAVRVTVARAVRVGLVILAFVALYCAIFYAWIEVATPEHARLNHMMGVICAWMVPLSIAGAIVIPRLILRGRSRSTVRRTR
jgi:hypothetical protein